MRTRRTDTTAMVFGLIFMGISGWYIFGKGDGIDVPSLGWIVALLLILLGIVGIASAIRNARD